MYPGIELRLLRYAVLVAEELHFSRAAIKLHVAQPSLSKQIKDLEEELGTALFERDKRHVRLTPAGAAFVKEAKQALMYSQRAKQAALAARRPWSLGYSPYVNPELVRRARTVLDALAGKSEWALVSAFTLPQLEMIRLGSVDAGLVTLPVAGDDLLVEPVLAEPLLVALPSRHRLARAGSLHLGDLAGIPMIATPREMHPLLHDQVLGICAGAGLEPRFGQAVTTFAEAFAAVADGNGFCFVRACHEAFGCPGVTFKQIAGDPLKVETGLAALRDNRSERTPALIRELGLRKAPPGSLEHKAAA